MPAEHLRTVGSSLPLETAARILDEAIAVRRREALLPLAVALLDAGGNLVAFKREVYVRALHHLAPFARTLCGEAAISSMDAPALPEPMRRRNRA